MATGRATVPAAGPSLDFEGFPSLADIEVTANAYMTGQKLCVFEPLVYVCTKCPSRVREFLWESCRAVAKGFCTHGDDAPVPIPNIMNLQQGKAALLKPTLASAEYIMQTASLGLLWSYCYTMYCILH